MVSPKVHQNKIQLSLTIICTLTLPLFQISLNGFKYRITLLSKIVIPSQRLSVSLRTWTVLPCLIIQVLNIKSLLPKYSIHFSFITSVHSNLEHGLAILTESFSPLRSVLHSLSCWSPKQKWCDKPHYSWYCLLDMCEKPVLTSFCLIKLPTTTKVDAIRKHQMPSGKFHCWWSKAKADAILSH